MRKRIEGTWPLGVAWMAVLIVVLLLAWSNMMESTQFYGIADSREIVVNSNNPVEISKIHVVEGESVIHGQLLLELRNPELMMEINQISHQLDQLKAQKDVDKTELKSKIAELNAQKNALITQTNHEIKELENVYAINASLSADLKSVTDDGADGSDKNSHPIVLKIKGLKQELASAVKLLDIQIDLQKQTLDAADKPVGILINQLEKDLAVLKRENSKLDIYSTISGVIGSVNYKVGEKVTPFAPILTLHTKTPSIIKGYIRENEYSRVSVGDKLSISSQTDSRTQVEGSVVGVGARIVEYPVRLRKHPDLVAWGREITVKIPENNNLILGEKVLISLAGKNISLSGHLESALSPQETIAGTPEKNEPVALSSPAKTENAVLPITPLDNTGIEASAVLYLPEEDQYLLASDDTPKKRLLLYLMDRSGQIVKEVPIDGVDQIDDIEAMARDENGTIYVAASMNVKKKGGPVSRRLLVTLKRKEGNFFLDKSVDLLNLLRGCALDNRAEQWASFLLNGLADGETDVEGVFCKEGALFLGFKSPFYMNRSMILKIDDIRRVLESNQLSGGQVGIWKMLSLKKDEFDVQQRISDLFYHEGNLYIAGVPVCKQDGKRSGSLWRMKPDNDRVTHIVHFKDLQPEGIAAVSDDDTLLVCFDQGSKYQSQVTLVKGISR